MNNFFSKLIGQGVSVEKMSLAIYAGITIFIIWALVILVAYLSFKIRLWRRGDFWFLVGTLIGLVVIKAVFLKYLNNYFFDRFPIYAFFSPKIEYYPAAAAVVALFLLWIKFYKHLLKINLKLFFIILILFSTIFSASVALMRDGAPGLYETFLRSSLDYYPDALRAKDMGLVSFLHDYDKLMPSLAMHGSGHPPGYAVIHYIFIELFNNNLILLALGIIFLGALTVMPIYFLARKFDESSARMVAMLFVFAPAFVIFSATCIDIVFLMISAFLFWSLFSAGGYFKWILSGAFYAATLFLQFMALLFLPIIALYSFLKNNRNLKKTTLELLVFAGTSAGIYLLMNIIVGFNIVKSFEVARKLIDLHVMSNYTSAKAYIAFILMSAPPFFIFLAGPLLLSYFKELRGKSFFTFDSPYKIFIGLGLAFLPVLLFAGIFQAETERLWLFLLPFFVLPAAKNITSDEDRSSAFMLLFLQIISIQILFYTYW